MKLNLTIPLYLLIFCIVSISTMAEEYYSDTTYYSINIDSSKIEWACDLHHGYLLLENGELTLVNGELLAGNFKICMESIVDLDIDYELMRITLQNTLKSKEFFNTEKYHYSSFEIDHVENNANVLFGDLTFIGVTKCIKLNYEFKTLNDSIFVTTNEITIDRTNWGNTSMSEYDAKSDKSFIVPNDVKIKVTLVGTKSHIE